MAIVVPYGFGRRRIPTWHGRSRVASPMRRIIKVEVAVFRIAAELIAWRFRFVAAASSTRPNPARS